MPSDPLTSLLARWHDEAAMLRRRGAIAQADVLDSAAAELAAALAMRESGAVTLAEAAQISGYTVDALGRLMRSGKLRNVGRPHAPRLRVADLPRKPHLGCAPRQTARPRLLTEGGR